MVQLNELTAQPDLNIGVTVTALPVAALFRPANVDTAVQPCTRIETEVRSRIGIGPAKYQQGTPFPAMGYRGMASHTGFGKDIAMNIVKIIGAVPAKSGLSTRAGSFAVNIRIVAFHAQVIL